MSKSKKQAAKDLSSEDSDSGPDDRNEPASKKQKTAPAKPANKNKGKPTSSGDDDGQMFQLGKMRYAAVREFRGKVMVDLREFYDKDGEMKPGKKGLALNLEQWQALKDHIDDIDEAIKNFD